MTKAEILLVCTGNIARSPFAAAVLAGEAQRRLLHDVVSVRSAGVHGLAGHPAVEEMVVEAATRGLDLTAHRGAPIDAEDVEACDLVLALTEDHRDRLVALAPQARARVFTLKEFARLAAAVTPPADDAPTKERVRSVVRAAHRARAHVEPASAPEDVEDPYGRSRSRYRACAAEIADLLTRVAPPLFGPVRRVAADEELLFGSR